MRSVNGEPQPRWSDAREMTASAAFAVGLAWHADRRALLHVVLAQLTTAVGLAVLLLLLRDLFNDAVSFGTDADTDRDRDASAASSAGELIPVLTAVVLAGTAGGILQTLSAARLRLLAAKVDRHVIAMVLRAAGRAELWQFEEPDYHDRLQRAVFASRREPTMVVTLMIAMLQTALTLLAVSAAFVVMAWWLLPFALLSAVPAVKTAGDERKARYGLHSSLSENRRLREYLERLLTGRDEAKELRALNLGHVLRSRWDAQYEREIDGTAAVIRTHLRRRIAARVAGDMVTAVVIAGMGWLVYVGLVGLPTAAAGLVGLWLLSSRLQVLAAMMNSAGESVLYVRDLRTFATEPVAEPAPPAPPPAPPASPAPLPAGSIPRPSRPFGEVRVEQVTFAYPGSGTPVLREVSMTLREGEVVALVGANGSGKTTLSKILGGLYRPTGGAVLLDGAPVDDLAAHREKTTVVFQDFTRYKLPALDNIAFGRPRLPADTVRATEAARRAGAHEFLEQLPGTYSTLLGKEFAGGVDLSGGQWQRLALARAFYRDSPFVILDEPTAALDPQAEAALFERIRGLFAGRTVLLISHRFCSVRHADRIYVLDEGRVAEAGTHESLMRDDGTYAYLFRLQAKAYQYQAAH